MSRREPALHLYTVPVRYPNPNADRVVRVYAASKINAGWRAAARRPLNDMGQVCFDEIRRVSVNDGAVHS